MVKKEILTILETSEQWGWVLEPDAKRIFSLDGFDVPKFDVAKAPGDVRRIGTKIGYPVVAKIVSPDVLHKSDVHGVAVGVNSDTNLQNVFERFSAIEGFEGMLVEEMISGTELIFGAKYDYQFGPMILLGFGGTGVEIYKDVSLRMAPIGMNDVDSMIHGLKAKKLLEGYRGAEPINMQALKRSLILFSGFVMKLKDRIESIDLNPVICTPKRCVIADARIILKTSK
ncbi:MAG TPA: acetate--CoA ligase family protein [Syntrophales bacterium]|nr:acetate--CoA ligase family protein [Syntrophales bacterium]